MKFPFKTEINLSHCQNMYNFRNKKVNFINFIQINNCAQGKEENNFPRIIFTLHKSVVISKGCEFNYKVKRDNKVSLTKTTF